LRRRSSATFDATSQRSAKNPDPYVALAPEVYGSSVESHAPEGVDESFAVALARAISRSVPKEPGSKDPSGMWCWSWSVMDAVC
jgi:hypothetical protein